MSGITDYSNRGNSSRLLLQVGAILVCCILTVFVILKGESGSYFTMRATVQFSLESEQKLFLQSKSELMVVELYGDVHPLSKSTPLIFQSGLTADHGYSIRVQFPMEAVGKSLNYRIVLRSDTGNDRGGAEISGTVSLAGGNTIVVINEADLKAGDKGMNNKPGQIVDLR
ncbi:MAG: hypothetical protein LC662_01045 [Rhodothermaceae bacterium]|nr:hypothetical protein [Rhodothermaceae bacterium]